MSSKLGLCFKNWLFLLVVSLLFGTASPLLAQDEDDEFTLEEITVTAEKREAELQKVAIDISVVRPEEMEEFGITSVYDISKIIPDVETDTSTGNQVMISIRGVGDADLTLWNPIHESSTAVHLDGIQLTRINGFDNLFYDLQRVEVLKGPQGTLYGRGSTAGSMNMMTQKPILEEFGGFITLEAGNYGLYRGEAALNIPVTEKLAFRIAGRGMKRDGFTDSGEDDRENRSTRLAMTWQPTDIDTITATYDIEHSFTTGYGSNGTYIGTYGNALINDTTYGFGITDLIATPYKSKWYKYTGSDDKYIENDTWGAMVQWERELPFGYGVLLYGHREMEEVLNYPFTFIFPTGYSSPTGDGINYFGWTNWDDYFSTSPSYSEGDFDSLEARLSSKKSITGGDKYEWLVGALAQDDYVYEHNTTYGGGTDDDDVEWEGYWLDIKTRSYGFFAQGTYQVLDKLNFTLGYRYAIDQKDYEGRYLGIYADTDYEWNEDTYKANLSYFITDSVMAFAQFSKGYKAANIDYYGNALDPEILNDWEAGIRSRFFDNRLQVNATVYFYDYKNYTSWETAYKCVAPIDGDVPADNDGTEISGYCYNVGGYNEDGEAEYDVGVDYEYYDSLSISPGGAEQYGGTLNMIYLLTAEDTITFNGSYSHNEYKDYNVGEAILAIHEDADNVRLDPSLLEDLSGEEFGSAPYHFNVGYTHTTFIGTDMLTFNATAFYTGEGVDATLHGTYDDEIYEYKMPGTPDYWTVDASITYNSTKFVPEGTSWLLRIWGNNLLGKEALGSMSYTSYSSLASYYNILGYTITPTDGYVTGTYINPRTYGITLTFEF